jgi:hypothetical protein
MAVAALGPIRLQPPRLAMLPEPPPPDGLLWSVLLHAMVITVFIWLPILLPVRPPLALRTPADLIRDSVYEPLETPLLPALTAPGGGGGGRRAGGSEGASGGARGHSRALPAASAAGSSAHPKAVYAGPQEIISDLPDATNTVQTLRRPDLIAPPKLRNPIRLRSMVVLPAPAIPALVAPPSPKAEPVPDAPKLAATPVSDPALPVRTPQRIVKAAQEVVNAPRVSAAGVAAVKLPARVAPAVSASILSAVPKAVIVINAVAVPAEPTQVVPDAEVSGSFAVKLAAAEAATGTAVKAVASTESGAAGAGTPATGGNGSDATGANGSGPGNGPGSANGGAVGNGTGSGSGNGSGTGKTGAGRGASGNAPGGSGSGAGAPGGATAAGSGGGHGGGSGPGNGPASGSGSGAGAPGPASGSGSIPGITISGGSSGGNRTSSLRTSLPHGTYGVTIIAGGNSGGASRDTGVFARTETVYTVYIPMHDAGGGPDCSMQYALVTTPTGNGLPAPPFATKKMRAKVSQAQAAAGAAPVFVAGIVDASGKLQALRAIHPDDPRAAAVLAALAEWEFQPAQLDAHPVAAKILIGMTVSVSPAEK